MNRLRCSLLFICSCLVLPSAVHAQVDDFHKHNVRVFFPTILWNQGTHNEGISDAEALAGELAAIGADGINGDTLDGIPLYRLSATTSGSKPATW